MRQLCSKFWKRHTLNIIKELDNLSICRMHFEWLKYSEQFCSYPPKTVVKSPVFIHDLMSISRLPILEIGKSDFMRNFISLVPLVRFLKFKKHSQLHGCGEYQLLTWIFHLCNLKSIKSLLITSKQTSSPSIQLYATGKRTYM